MNDYRDMTIWQLKTERDKIDAELRTRTNDPLPAAFPFKGVGYLDRGKIQWEGGKIPDGSHIIYVTIKTEATGPRPSVLGELPQGESK